MKCPSLKDLPSPPVGAKGWPWTEECEHSPGCTEDIRDWPRISIVTPSYNQGQFIEETIRSVLLQGYPDFEYIIIDGGSTDESTTIIRKYSPWLSYWVSESDRGQSHAINKGLSRCTGDIVAYINSDDAYLRDTFSRIAQALRTDPASNWLVGATYAIYDRNHPQRCDVPHFTDDLEAWYDRRCGLPQPSTFLRRDLLTQNGLFEETLSHAFDHEYWIRLILSGNRPTVLMSAFASFKLHDAAKTSAGPANFRNDLYKIEEMHEVRLPAETRDRLKRSRSIRRWETEIRDGLQLCAKGEWREGGLLLLRRTFDHRLPLALVKRPDILLRVLMAVARRLPQYIRDTLRRAIRGTMRSRTPVPSDFEDPLGEYDLWDRPPPGWAGSNPDVGGATDETDRS